MVYCNTLSNGLIKDTKIAVHYYQVKRNQIGYTVTVKVVHNRFPIVIFIINDNKLITVNDETIFNLILFFSNIIL